MPGPTTGCPRSRRAWSAAPPAHLRANPGRDELAPSGRFGRFDRLDDGQARPARLRPAALHAYTALAGALVSSLADGPARRKAAR